MNIELLEKRVKFVPIFIDEGFCIEEPVCGSIKQINETHVTIKYDNGCNLNHPINWLKQELNGEYIILESIT